MSESIGRYTDIGPMRLDQMSTGPVEYRPLVPRSAPAPQPFEITVNTNTGYTGTTFADLLLFGFGFYAMGVGAVFLFELAHNDWDVGLTTRKWYRWLLWPIMIPAHLIAYGYLKSSVRDLHSELPKECSRGKRVLMNTLAPGMGNVYCDIIDRLNRLKLQVEQGRSQLVDAGGLQAVISARRLGACPSSR